MKKKKKLIISIASFVLSISTLATTVFAWLSMNTQTNPNGMSMKVETSPNLIMTKLSELKISLLGYYGC